jgi:hypothetical protein
MATCRLSLTSGQAVFGHQRNQLAASKIRPPFQGFHLSNVIGTLSAGGIGLPNTSWPVFSLAVTANDAVSLVAVPEPSTFVLVGLAGLVLGFRRRQRA